MTIVYIQFMIDQIVNVLKTNPMLVPTSLVFFQVTHILFMIKRSVDFGDSFPNPNFLTSFAQMHTNKRSNPI
jgi:hypothetical protein